ncbi:protein SERAC1 isoform X2 [Rhodnius prolixus]|uniref:protein SERAC1 isoform X2 n=1 Tax=Rhodnius prolixus TaxID=13249 RepID=UPI003D18EAF6
MRPLINLTVETEIAETNKGEENIQDQSQNYKYLKISINKVQVVSSYISLLVPLFISIYCNWARKQKYLLNNIKKHISTVHLDVISSRVVLSAITVGEVLQITVTNRLVKSLLRPAEVSKTNNNNNEDEVTEAIEETAEKSVHCEVLHDPGPKRQADIIFIHGIKGALNKTWTQGIWRLTQFQVLNLKQAPETTWEIQVESIDEDGNGGRSICWPKDWLPKDCPTARIIALNYTTDPYLWRPFFFSKSKRTGMPERSWEMINNLLDIGVGKHSIIWVGHSKGGLYVKQMLVNACETVENRYRDLTRNTRGIMFYSVPHRGSPLANLNLPLFRQSIELTEVQKNCKEVLTLHKKFLELLSSKELKMSVKSFIETRLTLMGFLYVKIVSEESADAEVGELYGVPLDHRNICKPKNRECFLYKELVRLVQANCSSETEL